MNILEHSHVSFVFVYRKCKSQKYDNSLQIWPLGLKCICENTYTGFVICNWRLQMPIPGFYMRRNCILSKKTGNASFLFRLIPCVIFCEFCCVPISKWSQITNHKFATATHKHKWDMGMLHYSHQGMTLWRERISCWAILCHLSHDVKSAWHRIGARGARLYGRNS